MAAATAQTPAAPVRRVDADVALRCGLARRSATYVCVCEREREREREGEREGEREYIHRSATWLYASALAMSASRCSAK
jgi:hypothetical protein